MENVKKVTKKENFGRLIEIVEGANVEDRDALVEFLNHEIELVSRPRAGKTKAQKENDELAEKVYEVLARAEKEMTMTEVYNEMRDVEGITSPNKVNALLKKLKEDNDRIVRVTKGKQVFFKVPDAVDEVEG